MRRARRSTICRLPASACPRFVGHHRGHQPPARQGHRHFHRHRPFVDARHRPRQVIAPRGAHAWTIFPTARRPACSTQRKRARPLRGRRECLLRSTGRHRRGVAWTRRGHCGPARAGEPASATSAPRARRSPGPGRSSRGSRCRPAGCTAGPVPTPPCHRPARLPYRLSPNRTARWRGISPCRPRRFPTDPGTGRASARSRSCRRISVGASAANST
jgi:hypothetical protein